MTDTSSDHRGSKLSRAIRYVRTEPGLLRNVIAISVVIVLGVSIGLTILSQQRFEPPWSSRYYVWATYQDASSVAPGLGQAVFVNGVEIGQIQDADVDFRGRGMVMMSIDRSLYDRPVYRNAVAEMRPTTPLNTMYIDLQPGSPDAPEIPDYGVLPLETSISPIQIDEPLRHLDETTRDAIAATLSQAPAALERAPQDLAPGLDAVATTANSLQPVVAQLDTRREKIRQLITSLGKLSQAVGGNDVRLTNLANSLQTTLGAVAAQSDELRESFNQLPGVTRSLRTSTGAVQGLSDQLDPTLRNIRDASEDLPGALKDLRETVDIADTTVDKLRPVANKLKPTAADLRPFVRDLNDTFPDLKAIVRQANPITETLVPYLPDVSTFFYNTRSVVSTGDANGRNNLRALAVIGACSINGIPCNIPPGSPSPGAPQAAVPTNPAGN